MEEEDSLVQNQLEEQYNSQEVEVLDKSYYIIDDYYQNLVDMGSGKLAGKSFNVRVQNWQQGSESIEYVMLVEYLEGQGSKWNIIRRYTDF